MRLALFVVLAGCAFTPGRAQQNAPATDAATSGDAKPIDAATVAPDALDTWPCGVAPAAPGNSLHMTGNGGQTDFMLTAISFSTASSLVVVAPGGSFTYHYDWRITDTACAACDDQLEYGFVSGGRNGCDVDQTIPNPGGASGHVDRTLNAPTTPGTYDLRMNIGQNYSCNFNGATGWWAGTPASTRTIAKLCVH